MGSIVELISEFQDGAAHSVIGRVHSGQEFMWNGRVYKWVGPFFNQGQAAGDFYRIWFLPDMATRRVVEGHQNSITVQDKKTGEFFFADCCLPCEILM